jgi:N-hydroxyarylamine O-acetyltransferase
MDIGRYLERIGYHGDCATDLRTLRALHRAHMLSVPFENLDIALRRPIILDEQRLYRKVVDLGRGGFCYELNGLFATLLRAIGFTVDLLSACVWNKDHYTQDFDHMALMVHLKDGWLADVGFGASFIEPIRFVPGVEQIDFDTAYRLQPEQDRWRLESRAEGQDWEPQYQFSTTPYQLRDFEAMCQWQQTSPDSHFTHRSICSRATSDGRLTISDLKLIITSHKERREILLPDEAAKAAALWGHFGMDLSLV